MPSPSRYFGFEIFWMNILNYCAFNYLFFCLLHCIIVNKEILTQTSFFLFFLYNFLSMWPVCGGCYGFTEPAATILGGNDDMYVDKGSTINLTCTIRFGPEQGIFWYHENKVSNRLFSVYILTLHFGLFILFLFQLTSILVVALLSLVYIVEALSSRRNNENITTIPELLSSFRCFVYSHGIACAVHHLI